MKRSLSHPPDRLFYGWWIVIIGCVQDAVKGGTFNTGFTLYFLPILNELNLSRAATSLPFSLAKLSPPSKARSSAISSIASTSE